MRFHIGAAVAGTTAHLCPALSIVTVYGFGDATTHDTDVFSFNPGGEARYAALATTASHSPTVQMRRFMGSMRCWIDTVT